LPHGRGILQAGATSGRLCGRREADLEKCPREPGVRCARLDWRREQSFPSARRTARRREIRRHGTHRSGLWHDRRLRPLDAGPLLQLPELRFPDPCFSRSASGVMASWPGYERVYVHLSAPFSYEQWFRDLKAGRSMATNGPLLRVFADGKPPGSAFVFRKGRRVRLSLEAQAQGPIDCTEVVFNGEVVRSLRRAEDGVVKTVLDFPVEAPGWLAVRCFEPAGATIQYAHSSPFYFPTDGKLPVRAREATR